MHSQPFFGRFGGVPLSWCCNAWKMRTAPGFRCSDCGGMAASCPHFDGRCEETKLSERRNLPLDGVTVIDVGQVYQGPYATFLMAKAGANVIKVEPLVGEPTSRGGRNAGDGLPDARLEFGFGLRQGNCASAHRKPSRRVGSGAL
jgi:hypothetical protein